MGYGGFDVVTRVGRIGAHVLSDRIEHGELILRLLDEYELFCGTSTICEPRETSFTNLE